VHGQAAPLVVPLAEEGWTDGDVPRLVVRRYLAPLGRARVDVVLLGCTHYPLLRPILEGEVRDVLGDAASVVDSAHATATEVRTFLETRGLARAGGTGETRLLVTDMPSAFREMATRFLGDEVGEVEQVDL
jgi:glutamate racemase